jgi:hypothetical protein
LVIAKCAAYAVTVGAHDRTAVLLPDLAGEQRIFADAPTATAEDCRRAGVLTQPRSLGFGAKFLEVVELFVKCEEVVDGERYGMGTSRVYQLQRYVRGCDECVQDGASVKGEMSGDAPVDGCRVRVTACRATEKDLRILLSLIYAGQA